MALLDGWKLQSALMTAALMVSGCGDDETMDSASGSGSGSGSDSASGTSTMSTSESGSASATGSGGGSEGTSSTATSSAETTGAPVACGDLQCSGTEICVLPCCGGPSPYCGPPRGDTCPDGQHEIDPASCGACRPGGLCCEDDACQPDPPYCLAIAEAMCMDDPNSPTMQCSSPCFGPLVDGQLSCECA